MILFLNFLFYYIYYKKILNFQVALMGSALCELLRTPDKCRDALRVNLHLVSLLM